MECTLRNIPGLLESDEIRSILSDIGERAVAAYATYAPKGRTGKLSSSAHYEVVTRSVKKGGARLVCVVHVDASYAASVEFGHEIGGRLNRKKGLKGLLARRATRVEGAHTLSRILASGVL